METTSFRLTDVLNSHKDRVIIDEGKFSKALEKRISRKKCIEEMLLIRTYYKSCLGYYPLAMRGFKNRMEAAEYSKKYDIDPVFDRYNHQALKKMLDKETSATQEEIQAFLKCEKSFLKK